ncbi:hypothetical protein DFH09DRAFT_1106876 [Mycena vulgaris]|nr:hypothetical protein DFH09DRAFT_1106876 [Mycena vulgaris]
MSKSNRGMIYEMTEFLENCLKGSPISSSSPLKSGVKKIAGSLSMTDSAVHALASLISCQLLNWKGKSGHVKSHKTVCSTFKEHLVHLDAVQSVITPFPWDDSKEKELSIMIAPWPDSSQSGTGLFEEAEDDQSMKVQIIKSPKFTERWRKRGELARMKPFMKGPKMWPARRRRVETSYRPHRSSLLQRLTPTEASDNSNSQLGRMACVAGVTEVESCVLADALSAKHLLDALRDAQYRFFTPHRSTPTYRPKPDALLACNAGFFPDDASQDVVVASLTSKIPFAVTDYQQYMLRVNQVHHHP